MSAPDGPVQISGVRGVLVVCGLGHPLARAFVAGTLVGIGRACLGRPEEGYLRPQAGRFRVCFFLKMEHGVKWTLVPKMNLEIRLTGYM